MNKGVKKKIKERLASTTCLIKLTCLSVGQGVDVPGYYLVTTCLCYGQPCAESFELETSVRPSVRPAWCLPSLGYSPPSCPNFIIGIRAPCFCEGNLLRPAPPASLLLADNPLPSCFPSVRPSASAALDVPDPASQARAPVSPSALSPQIRTCQTFFLDSSCDSSALGT